MPLDVKTAIHKECESRPETTIRMGLIREWFARQARRISERHPERFQGGKGGGCMIKN
jgi:hypothetical protein